ncbi:winged helix-turn-helix transcriptional regulator [Methanoregula sp.]|uniref:winged helix-turn-helix transcriptional regulator n=1 Tax=Methanoregula sp. TaxID=2052170 RepID=UPI003C728404
MKKAQPPTADRPLVPAVELLACPLLVTMGVLGKKWTLLILRDIALLKINRFNQIRRSLPGLTSRVLVMRLHELEACGLIEAVVVKESPRVVGWVLTEKGKDTIPILMSIIAFGIKWYADEIFEDHRPRTMSELYPGSGCP